MKRIALLAGIAFTLSTPNWLTAQDQPSAPAPTMQTGPANLNHAEVGVFADYLRFSPATPQINFVGAGGRVGFNVRPNFGLEAEMSYDFSRGYTTTYNTGGTSTFVTTGVRPLTGLFGPKLQFGTTAPFRAFVTGKVGFVDFSTNYSGTFTGAVNGVGGAGTHVAFYPGGGFESFLGPFGLRFEAGDEIYLNSGTYNNLRVTAGPVFRF
ncbi:MAG: hypothetical protein ABSF17_14465 [Terracidiphilus sp.]|jgi:hypothetical protein